MAHPEAAAELSEPLLEVGTAFRLTLQEILELHARKSADYGRPRDPYANIRAADDFGVPGWVGAMIRANDKMCRIQRASQGHALKNENIEDSLIDLATYTIIALILFRESQ